MTHTIASDIAKLRAPSKPPKTQREILLHIMNQPETSSRARREISKITNPEIVRGLNVIAPIRKQIINDAIDNSRGLSTSAKASTKKFVEQTVNNLSTFTKPTPAQPMQAPAQASIVPTSFLGSVAGNIVGDVFTSTIESFISPQTANIPMPHQPSSFDLPTPGQIDITPNVHGHDVQIVEPSNILINAHTGKPMKIVPLNAQIRRRRRAVRSRGISASRVRELIQEERQNSMLNNLMMFMALGGRR